MKEVQTGFNDRWAYGVRTRHVQMARGGKEGNNALVQDLNNIIEESQWHYNEGLLIRIMETDTDTKLIDLMR